MNEDVIAKWSASLAILFTLLAAVAGVVGARYGSLVAARKEQELIAFQEDSRAALKAADLRVAEANENAAGATAVAAQANERTEQLAGDNAKLRERAAEAEANLLRLQQRVEPRQISADLRDRLIGALKAGTPKGTVLVMATAGDAESLYYGQALRSCLESAGWSIEYPQGSAATQQLAAFGLRIMVKNLAAAPAHALALQTALRSVGLTVSAEANPGMPAERVILFVGTKL